MIEEPEPPESNENPLAGVLDRLLRREQGQTVEAASRAADGPRSSASARTAEEIAPQPRRMLAVAGLGTDRGGAAVRSAAQWAAVLGRRPSITDLACGDLEDADFGKNENGSDEEGLVARARLPCGPALIREERAEIALALLRKLHRHESASDLAIVRIPCRERLTLMRAAFLSGAIVIPVEEPEELLDEALEITREILQSFLEIAVWPFATEARAMERYLRMAREHDGARILPFDPGHRDLGAAFDGLREPPREGFLVGLLAPEPAKLPEGLLRIDSVAL